jgi:ABC-type dipeptide/oligopeptide/nickel transport system permease subunit
LILSSFAAFAFRFVPFAFMISLQSLRLGGEVGSMSVIGLPISSVNVIDLPTSNFRRALRSPRVIVGGSILLLMLMLCLATLPVTLREKHALYFNNQERLELAAKAENLRPGPELWQWFGGDKLGRSILGRCLLGGSLSLTIGVAAALISVAVGVAVGLVAGYRGGLIDSILMRS